MYDAATTKTNTTKTSDYHPYTATNTTGASTCGYKPYINDCIHRLPCGLCTLLRTLCPCQTADKEAEDG